MGKDALLAEMNIEDVKLLFDVTDEAAAGLLRRHEDQIRKEMRRAGWAALELAGCKDKLPIRKTED